MGSTEPAKGVVPGRLAEPTAVAVPAPNQGGGLARVLGKLVWLKFQNVSCSCVPTARSEATVLVAVPKPLETITRKLVGSASCRLVIVSVADVAPEITEPEGRVPFVTVPMMLPLTSEKYHW